MDGYFELYCVITLYNSIKASLRKGSYFSGRKKHPLVQRVKPIKIASHPIHISERDKDYINKYTKN